MKIGILTFTNGTNYGQRLQNFALQNTIEKIGFEVFTIKQKPPYKNFFLKIKSLFKGGLLFLFHPRIAVNVFFRNIKFYLFNKKNINFYKKKLSIQKDNNWIDNEFDNFIVGSDQIWNPNSPYFNSNYFLSFANKKKRNSYAASFAVNNIPFSKISFISKMLKEMNNISVREFNGAKIILSICAKSSTVVLDPTFLLTKSEWLQFALPANRGKANYLITYFLGEQYTDIARGISNEFSLKIIDIGSNTNYSPSEFLYLINNAKLVLTDSYHGTIFSLIMNTPFVVFDRQKTGLNMNSRFDTLNKYFSIENRFYQNIKLKNSDYLTMDFTSFQRKIELLRKDSLKYLKSIILDSN